PPVVDGPDVGRFVGRAREPGERRRRPAEASRDGAGPLADRLEAMETQVIAASLHVRRGKGHVEGVAEDRQVLEEDLLLQVLRAGGNEDTLPAEDRRDEIGERLAGPGARFGEEGFLAGKRAGDGVRHEQLAGPRLEAAEGPGDRTVEGERRGDRRAQLRWSGYSGNFRHRASTSARTAVSA